MQYKYKYNNIQYNTIQIQNYTKLIANPTKLISQTSLGMRGMHELSTYYSKLEVENKYFQDRLSLADVCPPLG